MSLRDIPSVDKILQSPETIKLIHRFGRSQTLQTVQEVIADLRGQVASDKKLPIPAMNALVNLVEKRLEELNNPSLVPVINASGVILHTNLGRAPLSGSAMQAMKDVSQAYSNLEFDLVTGKRGSRLIHPEAILRRLTGVEDVMVVNNNAAAVLLILSALAYRKRVIIARSQLIEIGGEFRLPDVMKQSGARLVEVGATNKIHLSDFREALEEPASLVLHAHTSNYKIVGFTGEPDWKEVVALAHARGVSCVDDLGSGALLPTEKYGLAHERTVQDSLSAGSDLVCFSGDKLLGGPQAGIILGKANLLAKIKKHPLARAVRADKLCLSALFATLQHYLREEAEKEIPIWRMLSMSFDETRTIASRWVKEIGMGTVVKGESAVGGGSLPGEFLQTSLLSLEVKNPQKVLAQLRCQSPAIIARIERECILFDPRTVQPDQEDTLLTGIKAVLEKRITTTAKRG